MVSNPFFCLLEDICMKQIDVRLCVFFRFVFLTEGSNDLLA